MKNPPAMGATWVRSLGREDPLEKGTATHFSILAWRISMTVWSKGSQRVGHDLVTFTFTFQRDSKIRNTSSSNDKLPSVSIMSACFMNWDAKIQSEMYLTCNTEDPRKQPQVCSQVWSV